MGTQVKGVGKYLGWVGTWGGWVMGVGIYGVGTQGGWVGTLGWVQGWMVTQGGCGVGTWGGGWVGCEVGIQGG